ncbi:MAG: efflux transporter periplasmic adaptor subunit [Phenylobacterium sp.]|jgi:RND family efflux transporter MFP subunit|uniref:efflux RND transporter periplasmic adaptor subunit n=1 Tax=Phenylobacterium sp. TaxID=1871053 RepID=UPI002626761C|nr:efflux RND transporter periplasmic adaptor subunit [Phenylobacterium sp.]MDB5426671.1 efflux transporter periplasmic adaptor subunit [Phenylobacterium sp.]MDB5434436.1 efflux transporter periplasmic adaptor subunit [Phenylobacterium sp.]MDB5497354.1 efflux transporter periplasmic adaptor subunit [Phenylobacterium sp.]
MSTEPVKPPSRRGLMIIGAVALSIAAVILVTGVTQRVLAGRGLSSEISKTAVPTVSLVKLVRSTAPETLTLPGTIQPYNRALIYAQVTGYLKGWNQDIGAQVKAGQLLATINTPDLDQQLEQAKAEVATAEANDHLAALTAARWQALLPSQSVAQQDADTKTADAAAKRAMLNAARANVRRLQAMESFKRVVAPFDGVVTARKTDIGALINSGSQGQGLFEVADLHKVRIYIQAPQSLSADLLPGLKATFDLPQFPGQHFDAVVVASSNAVEATSRSTLVQLQADNPNGKLFAGAYAQVHFQLPARPNTVRLPASAMVPSNRGTQVAVLGADGKVAMRSVELGRDLGDSVEVVAGLSPSDRVIDSPPETLQNGQTVKLAAATPPPAKGK